MLTLKKGHLVETDHSGLMPDYVGQAATKDNKITDENWETIEAVELWRFEKILRA